MCVRVFAQVADGLSCFHCGECIFTGYKFAGDFSIFVASDVFGDEAEVTGDFFAGNGQPGYHQPEWCSVFCKKVSDEEYCGKDECKNACIYEC